MMHFYYRFRDRHGSPLRVVCLLRGHQYPNPVAPGYCLYFCTRCGREICGRVLEDINTLPPIPQDLRESLDRLAEQETV